MASPTRDTSEFANYKLKLKQLHLIAITVSPREVSCVSADSGPAVLQFEMSPPLRNNELRKSQESRWKLNRLMTSDGNRSMKKFNPTFFTFLPIFIRGNENVDRFRSGRCNYFESESPILTSQTPLSLRTRSQQNPENRTVQYCAQFSERKTFSHEPSLLTAYVFETAGVTKVLHRITFVYAVKFR